MVERRKRITFSLFHKGSLVKGKFDSWTAFPVPISIHNGSNNVDSLGVSSNQVLLPEFENLSTASKGTLIEFVKLLFPVFFCCRCLLTIPTGKFLCNCWSMLGIMTIRYTNPIADVIFKLDMRVCSSRVRNNTQMFGVGFDADAYGLSLIYVTKIS